MFGCLLRTVVYCPSLLFSFFCLGFNVQPVVALRHFHTGWCDSGCDFLSGFWCMCKLRGCFDGKFTLQNSFSNGLIQERYKKAMIASWGAFCVFAICGSPIMHLVCPPPPKKKKNCIIIVFNFSWDNCNSQEKWKTKVFQNFWGVRWGAANGEWVVEQSN